jgi:23S rRNA pseudouridine2605 synthase
MFYHYFAFYKPLKTISSLQYIKKKYTIRNFLFLPYNVNLHIIGRLDYDVSGILLLTNDGQLTNRLAHPYFKISKTYFVKIKGIPSKSTLLYIQYKNPIINNIYNIGITKKKNTWVKLILSAGQNRHIVNIFWQLKTPVLKIVRIAFGKIYISNLSYGHTRKLSNVEILSLYSNSIS